MDCEFRWRIGSTTHLHTRLRRASIRYAVPICATSSPRCEVAARDFVEVVIHMSTQFTNNRDSRTRTGGTMPVAYIDIPTGLTKSAKAQLVKDVAESIHNAYPIPDTRVLLREWTAEQTSVDGALGAAFRPICDFIVPPGLPADGKRLLVSRVSSAIVRACDPRVNVVSLPSGKQMSTRWVLLFFREVPLEQAALDELMAFENPMVLESLEGKAMTGS